MTGRVCLSFVGLDEAEQHLGVSVASEAKLRGVAEAEVLGERQRWVQSGVSYETFLQKWRELNGVTIAAYCRLTGQVRGAVQAAIKAGVIPAVADPFTARPLVQIGVALAQGFSFDQIRRAARGDPIHLLGIVETIMEVRR